MLAVKEFFKTENIIFVYLDLKNKENIEIKYSSELYSKYTEKLTDTLNRIKHTDNPPKKNNCNCEYSMLCY